MDTTNMESEPPLDLVTRQSAGELWVQFCKDLQDKNELSEPRPNIILASMRAISDFRADNGSMLVALGCHNDRIAEPDEIISAEMLAGSLFFWLGGSLRGAGANSALDRRHGVVLTYSLGWVR